MSRKRRCDSQNVSTSQSTLRPKQFKSKYDVVACPTAKSCLPQSVNMRQGIIATFPSMWLIVGRSGCGKSTVVQFLLDNEEFMGGFFNRIKLFSPTGKMDDIAKQLHLSDDDIETNPSQETLLSLLDEQQEEIESKGIEEASKTHRLLVLCDDIISSTQFLNSPAFVKVASMGRHYLTSTLICAQSYTKIPRVVRLQAKAVIFFPSNQDEVDLIVADHCPPHTHKQVFRNMVEYATSNLYDFLHINNCESIEKRYRKCFKSLLVPTGLNNHVHSTITHHADKTEN